MTDPLSSLKALVEKATPGRRFTQGAFVGSPSDAAIFYFGDNHDDALLAVASDHLARAITDDATVEGLARGLCENRLWLGAWEQCSAPEKDGWTQHAEAALAFLAGLAGEGRE